MHCPVSTYTHVHTKNRACDSRSQTPEYEARMLHHCMNVGYSELWRTGMLNSSFSSRPSINKAYRTVDQHMGQSTLTHVYIAVPCLSLIQGYDYLRQGGYVIVVVCLSVCLPLATLHKKFPTDLHEIFTKDLQCTNEQMIKFWWRS